MDASGHTATGLMSDAAYDSIQHLIISGALPGGAMISENDLRTQLQCGRTPIREALQRLQMEGFVDIHPRRGALVTTFDIRGQLELLEVRRPLEDLMVRLSAVRADKTEREQMRGLADRLEAAVVDGNSDANLRLTAEVHALESQATKNRTLQKSIGQVHLMSRRFWYSFLTAADTYSVVAGFHVQALRAIAAGDADSAAKAAAQLLTYLDKITREAIGRTFGPGDE